MPATQRRRRRARNPQLERETPLVAIAVARQVLEEASLFLGAPLPSRYAAGLAFSAKIVFARSPTFRRGFRHRADGGRERLYVFMRHWLAARLHAERYDWFRRLPASYCTGEPLPLPLEGTDASPMGFKTSARRPCHPNHPGESAPADAALSNDARLIAGW